jgi:uncharacterized protein (TIGR02646 family)
MKYIKKGPEPEVFQRWKERRNDDWTPSWNNFANPEKSSVKMSLLVEQGFLCCYCCRRIRQATSHIEHLKSRDEFPMDALDYGNFLGCCMGEAEDPPPAMSHCGHHKQNWYVADQFVSPLEPDCEEYFSYTAYGDIVERTGTRREIAARNTITRLNLDCAKLRRLRKSAIDAVTQDLDVLSNADIQILRRRLRQPDAQGEYGEFLPAILHVLDGLSP